MTKITKDPALEAVRRVRHEISEEMGHDPRRLLEYYRRLEAEYAERLVHSTEGTTREPQPFGG
jgi:hypothetical protein